MVGIHDDGNDDRRLVERFQHGDSEAFADVVERYQQPLHRYLLRLTDDYDLAEDLTQETLVHALRALGNVPPELALRPWLYRIAANLACDYWRRQRRIQWLPLAAVDRRRSSDPTSSTVERISVERALAGLRGEERMVLLLCGGDRAPYAEAAASLGGSAEAIRKRFGRARSHFRSLYAEQQ